MAAVRPEDGDRRLEGVLLEACRVRHCALPGGLLPRKSADEHAAEAIAKTTENLAKGIDREIAKQQVQEDLGADVGVM
jgi:hypothetical protein